MKSMVLDTNVLVTALRSPDGSSAKLLNAVFASHYELLVSPALFLEYEAVLKRPELLKAADLKTHHIDDFLEGLCVILHPVDINYLWRPQLRDPADEMVLETAVNGRANCLVTWNVKDFLPAAHSFGLRVIRPNQLTQSS